MYGMAVATTGGSCGSPILLCLKAGQEGPRECNDRDGVL